MPFVVEIFLIDNLSTTPIDRKRALTADLRIEGPPGAEVLKPGFAELGGCNVRRRTPIESGVSGGTAFAAAHRRVCREVTVN